jgi:CRP/FNR family transcriptional regulator, cyclic AMP receptor protein
MTKESLEFLRTHPVFNHLPPACHDELLGTMREASLEVGEALIQEGHAADHFYILLDGSIDLFARLREQDEQWIQMIHPGEMIGWSWLVPPYRWALGARARVPSRLYAFDARVVREMCVRDPVLGHGLLQRICGLMMERLHTVRTQMAARLQGVEAG